MKSSTAEISASFGTSGRASASLPVRASVLDVVDRVTWSVPLSVGNTLVTERDGSRATTVSLRYASGLELNDVGSSAYSGWLTLAQLVNFSSALPAVVEVNSVGQLTLRDNWYVPTAARASVLCNPAVYAEQSVVANLAPAVNDVDSSASPVLCSTKNLRISGI